MFVVRSRRRPLDIFRVSWVCTALLAGCVGDNPDYRRASGEGGVALPDAGRADLAHAVAPPDLAQPPTANTSGSCGGGARRGCGPAACPGAFIADRTCPTGSTCVNGYCGPPEPVP